MPTPIAQVTAYLKKLEADRLAAIELSEQKAEEAKLIAVRQEGFRAAMDILAGDIPVDNCELQPETYGRRRQRRDIKLLVLRELSFSGEPMTTAQIAKAIGYIPERTETVLQRLENGGKLRRDERSGRWALVITGTDLPSEPASAREGSSATAAAA